MAELARGTAHLSRAVCGNLAEAASVCLESRGHTPGVKLTIDKAAVEVVWGALDLRAEASHDDPQDATEEGAVAVAIELVRGGTGLDLVRRSRKGTGFDYHLGPRGSTSPFAGAACLEVSGILEENASKLEARAQAKVAQVLRQGSGVPGFAVVVGFTTPRAIVRSFG